MSHSCLSVAKYLLDKAQEQERFLTPMKLIKLVCIAHGWMLGLYGKPLINENVEAWKYGPVVRELYHAIKQYRNRPIPPEAINYPDDFDSFNEREEQVMDQTMDIYGRFSALNLSRMTHSKGTPWDIVYNQIGRDFPIDNELIEEHYRKLYDQAIENQHG